MKSILFVVLAALAFVSFADIDARLPEKTACAAVVDFDALRPHLPQIGTWIREGFAAAPTNASWRADRIKRQSAAYDQVQQKTAAFLSASRISLSGIHWVMVGVRNEALRISRDRHFNMMLWQGVLKANGVEWDRVSKEAERQGVDCMRKRLFGRTLYNYSCFPDRGDSAPLRVVVVPADRDLTFFGQGELDFWNVYFDAARVDDRFVDFGRLESGEIVRLVLADPDFTLGGSRVVGDGVSTHSVRKVLGDLLLPSDLRSVTEQLQRIELSLYLADEKIGAQLRVDFKDPAVAELVRSFCAAELDKLLASDEMKTIPFCPRVSIKDSQVVFDTGRGEAAWFFRLFAEPLGELCEELVRIPRS